ncbi:GntR family transcriptional regulator [Sodalis sp. dw_96]|uniref:GntR family transcriptional regulator n=1 Tax=Sodalis sp. dw_96 TaxID=2719794 RepID=UPI001BD61836|nr:GntR family transcriptional regulator [Sodalis sp. dw_96]
MEMTTLGNFLKARMALQPNGLRSAIVARVLEEAVQAGELLPGEKLPAERLLCEVLDVSRTTLRSGLEFLEESGVIDRRPGAGTFISARVMAPKEVLTGFSKDMENRGVKAHSRLLSTRRGLVLPDETFNLGLAPGAWVLRLEQLRFADQIPIYIESSVIPVDAVPAGYDGSTSLYAAMLSMGTKPVKIVQRYGAVLATAEQAAHLGISAGDPLLVLQRLGFSAQGHAVEFTRSHFRGDRFFISTELDV